MRTAKDAKREWTTPPLEGEVARVKGKGEMARVKGKGEMAKLEGEMAKGGRTRNEEPRTKNQEPRTRTWAAQRLRFFRQFMQNWAWGTTSSRALGTGSPQDVQMP